MMIFGLMGLYVLRHGDAGKRLPAGSKDSERALTVTGKQEVEKIAEALQDLGVKFDFVATSPLKRAYQTAEIIAKTLKVKKGKMEGWDELKPEGKRPELYRRLSQFKQQSSVLVVGHEPYLSTMIREIVFGNGREIVFGNGAGIIILKKAGLARVEVTSFQPNMKAELRWLLTPKLLKNMIN
jgi:phosphohistidine phosphatase